MHVPKTSQSQCETCAQCSGALCYHCGGHRFPGHKWLHSILHKSRWSFLKPGRERKEVNWDQILVEKHNSFVQQSISMSAKSNPSKTDPKFGGFFPNTVLQTVSFAKISWYPTLQQKWLFWFLHKQKRKEELKINHKTILPKKRVQDMYFQCVVTAL